MLDFCQNGRKIQSVKTDAYCFNVCKKTTLDNGRGTYVRYNGGGEARPAPLNIKSAPAPGQGVVRTRVHFLKDTNKEKMNIPNIVKIS